MENRRFSEQIHAFGEWKAKLIDGVKLYQKWLDNNDMNDSDNDLRIYDTLSSLDSNKLTVAFLAEFARGKTELINAIFFSEYDRRLLPSEAGRTTMCPTELFYDDKEDYSYIRLLPIETRLNETSIAEYREQPIHWTSIKLDLKSPESMADAFKEIVKTKHVDVDEARKLGLYTDADAYLHNSDGKTPESIDIPLWRHALISFPHPFLKEGLVILDTPGLNAIGSEPELTMNMLPKAQGVMFVMAADTGVTKSDLDMWNQNVKSLRKGRNSGLIVIMNKIDTLWDDLKKDDVINKAIQKQCADAAKTLGIPVDAVIPASAQKGLLAKIRHDEQLLERSNILALESMLANEIIPQQKQLVREHVVSEIGDLVKSSRDTLTSQLISARDQLKELHGLSGKNAKVIEHLMKKTREEQVEYHKNVDGFNKNKKILKQQSTKLIDLLSLKQLDKLVADSRKEMTDTWTTVGLRHGMKTFFDGITQMFAEVDEYTDQLNRLVTTLYTKFNQEHGFNIEPVQFTSDRYMKQMLQLNQQAEEFRTSPVTTLTEQSFVIKKFFISLVSHARNIFFKANRDADKWSKDVLSPLMSQIKAKKQDMEKRLNNLRKVHESHETLQERMDELKKEAMELKRQYAEVNTIYSLINGKD